MPELMMQTILSVFACLSLLALAPSCSCIDGKVVVGYFTDWSHYRPGAGSYDIKKIDVCKTPCTHLVYSFAKYDHKKNGLLIEDMAQGLVPILTGCAKEGKTILLAFGGWTYSTAEQLSPLFESEQVIDEFIVNAHKFIKDNNFHGLDMDLEYPGYYQATTKSPGDHDKKMFSYLLKGLKKKFQADKFLLTVAVSANPEVVDVSYEVDVLNLNADWIGLMAYDYYSYRDNKTGLCAPFTNQLGETRPWNVQDSVQYWLDKGLCPDKVVLGMPLYGKSFKLADINSNGIGAPANREPDAGKFTGEVGVLSFQEICIHIEQDDWTEVYLEHVGAYAYNDQGDWVGYDSVESLIEKTKFILEKQLKGAMFWELGFDDFNNQCGCGLYPMLTAFQETLKGRRAKVCPGDD
ncbi:probable chitinase 10 [Adelges cooleyi]|uniref:probable chitinase 10 n=1 Tax=Adelges cooleyi TaxID=133065 RepID=UPI002180922B|nr:probable chitinase 10 [Adelges cooleyi]